MGGYKLYSILASVSISIKHLKIDFTAVNTIFYDKNSNLYTVFAFGVFSRCLFLQTSC